ncbi:hypothetical protein GIB67_022778 [Kingdonia uniflora]|uniref:Uncharacterized protein n=1 Tax=Kingdonia uniflora TaxID=39325 RepID=A0A7J7P6M4_9MAGN|nr:hypothetical protein GIB67_022778 [Kingdonia uniflora]
MVTKFDPVVFCEMLNLAIIRHQLPFKFMEYERIRDAFTYMVFANRELKLVSRNTARANVIKIHEREKKKVMTVLHGVVVGLSMGRVGSSPSWVVTGSGQ